MEGNSSSALSMEVIRSQELELKPVRKQVDRLNFDPSDEERKFQDLLIKLFTTSKMELGTNTTVAGSRSRDQQKAFARALHDLSNSKHPDPSLGANPLWCPITGLYWSPSKMKAAHIYPFASGAVTMQALFQTDELELFSPLNGICMCSLGEKRLDSGCLVLVPGVGDQTNLEQMTRWYNSKPREYNIRIAAREADEMQGRIQAGSDLRWLDLDNRRVQFRCDHRPHARYLHYLYLVTMLRRSWNPKLAKPADVLKDELGKPWWGTRKRRLRSSQLLQAIIEEGGHNYYALKPGSNGEGEGEGDEGEGKGKGKAKEEQLKDMEKDLVMGTANAHIASSLQRAKEELPDLDYSDYESD